MILIYNGRGLVFGLVGVLIGLVIALTTGWVSAGLVGVGVTWLIFGGRKADPETGVKGPWPSIYLVPIRIWAIPVVVLGIAMCFVEFKEGREPADARKALLKADESHLRVSQYSGDSALSEWVGVAMSSVVGKMSPEEKMRVFSRVRGDAVLALAQVPTLSKIRDPERRQMLEAMEAAIKRERPSVKEIYIGVKGKLMYGAIRTPEKVVVGGAVREAELFGFYGDAGAGPATRPGGEEATSRPAGGGM